MFKPKIYSDEELDVMIERCINGVISPDADEAEIRWWGSVIPEALRYILRKQKHIYRKIETINVRLEEIDAKFKLVYIHSSKQGGGTITERKDFSEAMKIAKSKQYKQLVRDKLALDELWSGYDADRINLEEKSFMIRKYANFESGRTQYEE